MVDAPMPNATDVTVATNSSPPLAPAATAAGASTQAELAVYSAAIARPNPRRKIVPDTPRHGAPTVRCSRTTSRSWATR